MLTRVKQQVEMPYSLHDMVVDKITCRDESVYLEFAHGYVSTQEPYPQVDGRITLEGVDMDSACVLLLSPLGRYGRFQGEKLTLEDFLKRYRRYSFEIVDEMYGFNQVKYTGYLSVPEKERVIQTSLPFYFTGDIVYETEET